MLLIVTIFVHTSEEALMLALWALSSHNLQHHLQNLFIPIVKDSNKQIMLPFLHAL